MYKIYAQQNDFLKFNRLVRFLELPLSNDEVLMLIRILTVLLLLSFAARGQRDLIITQAGEQIRCKITGETSMRFSYSYKNDKGKTANAEIFKTLVSSFKYNYFPDDKAVSEVSAPQKKYVSPLKQKTEFSNYLKYRVGFKGGLSNLMEKVTDPSDYGKFTEKLRRGWHYGADATVFLNDHIGLGVTYSSYQANNKNRNFDFPNRLGSGEIRTGSLETKINHKFVGPMLVGRIPMDYKTFVVATLSPGYTFYSDKGTENKTEYSFKGKDWGAAASLGLDFLLGNNDSGRDVILSIECGYHYGKIRQLNQTSLENPIDLSRLDFSVGLRFNRFPRHLK